MDAADRERGGHHGHRIETSQLPLKKRASNYADRISAGDPYTSSSKKKKRVHDDIVVGAETNDTAGAFDAPVPRQRRSVPAAASREPAAELPAPPAAGSPEPAANGKAAMSESDEEKKWLSKGKWLAKDQSSSLVTLTPQPPPVKKLMHDGIRSFVPQQLRDEHRRHAAAAVPPLMHGGYPALSPALERRLAELGATRPWLVQSKVLQKSDVDVNQNRLLVSCKRGSGTEDCPITGCFSAAELRRVNKKLAGLAVTAFDRGGSSYALNCKFLKSNSGYRFISEWKDFLIQNGLNLDAQEDKSWTRDVEVELWAFRSRRLPFQPQLDADGKKVTEKFEDENGEKVSVDLLISHHLDPDGALGLLLLHHEMIKNEEEEGDDDWKQGPSLPPRSVARKKGKQKSGKRSASAAAAAPSPVALPAPVAEQGGARWREELLCAAIGLAKLRQSIRKQWQEYVDRGGGHGAKGSSNDVVKSTADVAKSSADVEGEKINKEQKSPGTHSRKERGANSQTVDSFGSGGSKTSTEDMALDKVIR